jgi:oxygen-independent coproporphyrinogen III oxidase
MGRYVERLCDDIASCRKVAAANGAVAPEYVNSIYLGGGTPSLLPSIELTKLFSAIANEFSLSPAAEITVECAPGTLTQPIFESLVSAGVNRVSLGVQSFVDKEAASVARLHDRATVLSDIERLRRAGIGNINIDLIAGLPHQTAESWAYSLDQALATGVPHISVYMLEVDHDSRLGRELIAGGSRYHAHFVPDDDATAGFYEAACSRLQLDGVVQYEISNFARAGFESLHNLKYWTRQPYLGFGVDAHSMLPVPDSGGTGDRVDSIRLATTDSFDHYFVSPEIKAVPVRERQALEESFFLGLRLNRGVNLQELTDRFGAEMEKYNPVIEALVGAGMLSREAGTVRLTSRGRLLSNEVFQNFILDEEIERVGVLNS